MNFFSELNKKLDEGWKLTDSSCPICKASIIYNPVDKSLYCLKCAKPCKQLAPIVDEQPDTTESTANSKSNVNVDNNTKKPASQELKKSLTNKNRKAYDDSEDDPDLSEGSENEFKGYMHSKTDQSRTDDISKLLSQKLLQGYAMLQECCGTCMAPVMRSKNGQYTCVGCKWVKSKKEFDQLIDQANNPQQPSKELNSNTNQGQKPQSEQPLQTNQPTAATTGSTSSKPQTQPQAPAQVQKLVSSSSNNNSQDKEEFYKSVQRTLNIAAAFYEGQIAQLAQLNQSAMIDNIVKSSLRELIETQKALEKTE